MFITIEGSDGSGKSTQFELLAAYLLDEGYDIITTREPGGTNIGEQVRECLHDVRNRLMTAEAEVLLYSASRAQLVEEIIRPALAANRIVLSDRYYDSTLAYQGYGRRLDLEALVNITMFATGGLKPDLTVFLEVDITTGLSRREVGGVEMNRMDLQATEFYERVQKGYESLVASEPERWITIDANRPIEMVQMDVRQRVVERLQEAGFN
ncbi:MAG TPA: dTMP kinase [candidate division Zixibacteria bacterium]|nr:dTMP kinase [candidate division Zixibacteria bacterium]